LNEIKKENNSYYFFKSQSSDVKVSDHRLSYGRYIIGRSDSADIKVNSSLVSGIHAVIEIGKDIKIFDMNSLNGVVVEGKRIVVSKLSVGDKITIGNLDLILMENEVRSLPKVLNISSSKKIKKGEEELDESLSQIDESIFVYEEIERVHPVFSYDSGLSFIELQISKNDRIYSINYLDISNGNYFLKSKSSKLNEIELPILRNKKKIKLIDNKKDHPEIISPDGFKIIKVNDNKGDLNTLNPNDTIILQKEDLILRFRRSTPPPIIQRADFFEKDQFFFRVLGGCFLLIFTFLISLSFLTIDEEVIENKQTKRLVRIILDKEKYLEKVNSRRSKIKAKDSKEIFAKVEESPRETQAKKQIKSKNTNQKKIQKKLANKKTNTNQNKASSSSPVRPSQGRVESFESPFKGLLSNVLSKGGSNSNLNNSTGDSGSGLSVGQGREKVKIADETVRDFNQNNIDEVSGSISKGIKGLSRKRQFISARFLGDTVVYRGSMDPAAINKILNSYIPQFRVCGNKQPLLSSSLKMAFTIGSSGHAVRTKIISKYNGEVKRCVSYILRGIQFPVPKGGGTVDVERTLNIEN